MVGINDTAGHHASYVWRQKAGFPLGLALFFLILIMPGPPGLAPEAQRAAAVAALMATWWMTEALPIAVTALVPLAAYPFLSVLNMQQTAAPYANPNIFLFMGGFMIATAMQKWNLHKRLGLIIISRIGAGRRRMLLGFMTATALISMWVSNTATTVMMLPIAMAVVEHLPADPPSGKHSLPFGAVLMLGIAYSASVGGIATLIGTPPNVIFAGQSRVLFPQLGEIGFVRWMQFALPLSVGFFLFIWGYLEWCMAPPRAGADASREVVEQELAALGPWSRGEMGVMAVFIATALAWIGRADVAIGPITLPGWQTILGLKAVHDGTVAMGAALLLFSIPVSFKNVDFLLDWEWAKKLPWDVLLLFGGGFALAESFRQTGLAAWLVTWLDVLRGIPVMLVVLATCFAVTFLTEVTSNTATASMLIPVLAATAAGLGIHPYLLMIPATVSASCAFMLPVATPPNAIVFGSGYLTIPQMARTGLVLNVVGVLWVTLITYTLVRPLFGI